MQDLPFSEGVRVGNVLYVSGMIGIDTESGAPVPGGIRAETQQTMENIRTTLDRPGSSMCRIVNCTVFLTEVAGWGATNEIYVE